DVRVYNSDDIQDPVVRRGKGRPTKRLKALMKKIIKLELAKGTDLYKTGHYAPKCPNEGKFALWNLGSKSIFEVEVE
ncbi:14597_t:CDS:2, partial [Funneliformis caledonium]